MRAALLFALSVAAAAQGGPGEGAIRAARLRSNQAFKARDAKQVVETLTDDFTITRGNGTAVSGRQAYLEALQTQFANPKSIWFERVTDKIEMSSATALAAEHGHWQGRHPDGRKAYGGAYLAMWKQTAGVWKIRSELFVVLTCDDTQACRDYTR